MKDNVLISSLLNAEIYPHPVSAFQIIQTHLSWVILTGDFAYKIKKPLNLGFQDFTTLEKRKYYCELEVSLNQQLASPLYLGVCPITGSFLYPRMGGNTEPIEYAIKMLQFSQNSLLNVQAMHGGLKQAMIEDIAKQVANFHHGAKISKENTNFGTPSHVLAPMMDNFSAFSRFPWAQSYQQQLDLIQDWTQNEYNKLESLIGKRKKFGFVRACHGDLHLGNIVEYQHKLLIFDCIEFNEDLRFIDVVSDIGFLAMDLLHYHLPHFSYLLINEYFEHTHDYEGLLLLKLYQCYRAMVRAKITAFQISQLSSSSQENSLKQDLALLLALALAYTKSNSPRLTITVGISGSGKTTTCKKLVMKNGAIALRSDTIRKALLKQNPYQSSTDKEKLLLYQDKTTTLVYTTMQAYAFMLLKSGYSVIIDATCLKQQQRQLFIAVAEQLTVPFNIIHFNVTKETALKRIQQRMQEKQNVSDADEHVLAKQIASFEPFTETEKKYVILQTG